MYYQCCDCNWKGTSHCRLSAKATPVQNSAGKHKQVNLITEKYNMICHKSFILFSGVILECYGNATIILENDLCIAVVFQLIW